MCSAMSRELVSTTLQCHTPQDLLELRNNKKCQKDQCKKKYDFQPISNFDQRHHENPPEAPHWSWAAKTWRWPTRPEDARLKLWGRPSLHHVVVGGASEEMLVWQHPANGTRSCLTWPGASSHFRPDCWRLRPSVIYSRNEVEAATQANV